MSGISSVASHVGVSVGSGARVAAIRKQIAQLEKELEAIQKDQKIPTKQKAQLTQMMMFQIQQLEAELAKLHASRAPKKSENETTPTVKMPDVNAPLADPSASAAADVTPAVSSTLTPTVASPHGNGVDTYT
ncbi:MAG: FlxA-like family protein [Azonexus sp.]|nr:FlxA-like family protein [Azonexus sp.]